MSLTYTPFLHLSALNVRERRLVRWAGVTLREFNMTDTFHEAHIIYS